MVFSFCRKLTLAKLASGLGYAFVWLTGSAALLAQSPVPPPSVEKPLPGLVGASVPPLPKQPSVQPETISVVEGSDNRAYDFGILGPFVSRCLESRIGRNGPL